MCYRDLWLAISALEGKKKKKRRAAFQLLAPFPLVPIIGPRNRVSENSFFRVEESGAIVEFL